MIEHLVPMVDFAISKIEDKLDKKNAKYLFNGYKQSLEDIEKSKDQMELVMIQKSIHTFYIQILMILDNESQKL